MKRVKMKNRRMFWQIAEKIESLINSGLYPPGSRLPPERELADTYNVSRPTIREAIIALEVMELVEVKTSSGVYVLEYQHENNQDHRLNVTAFELTQARAFVEGEVAALAAHSITDKELQALRRTLLVMEQGKDAEKADKEFHHIIAKATKNAAIMHVIEKYWQLRVSQTRTKQAYSNVCKLSNEERLKEHTLIYDALKNHDSNGARAAMHKHFSRIINALFELKEAHALEEARKKSSQMRDLYSLNHLNKSVIPN